MKKGQAHIRADELVTPEPTPRETQVIALIANGRSGKEIAMELGIAHKTAEAHRYNLMGKLGLHGIADITRYAIANGLIPMPVTRETTRARAGAALCEALGA